MKALIVLAFLACACDERDPMVRAVTEDPAPDPKFPAAMEPVLIPSGGVSINALIYLASGSRAHPAVVFLHGFPGNEQNLDLAQAMRRVGWNVLTLHYRGAWGSPGTFSFSHAAEDAQAAVAFLRDPANARRYRVDANKIVVIGHSMGGFLAANAAGALPEVAGLGVIAAWNIVDDADQWARASSAKLVDEATAMRPDTVPLQGTTAEELIQEAIAHRAEWNFTAHASQIGSRPVLVISTDDGGAAASHAYVEALRTKARVTEVHFATDHSLSDHRIALHVAVARWLATIR